MNEGGRNGKIRTHIAPRHPLLLDCFCWTGCCWYCIYKTHQLAVCSVFLSSLSILRVVISMNHCHAEKDENAM